MNRMEIHIDGERHFIANGRNIESVPLNKLVDDAVVTNVSNHVDDYDVYTSEMVANAADVQEGDILSLDSRGFAALRF